MSTSIVPAAALAVLAGLSPWLAPPGAAAPGGEPAAQEQVVQEPRVEEPAAPEGIAEPPELPAGAPLTLVAAVERALGGFPGVAAARAREQEAQEALAEVEAARRARGRFTGSAMQFQEPMLVTPIHDFGPRVFPAFDETLFQGTLAVQYTLFDGGATGARIRAAAAQAEVAGAALGAAEQAVALRVAVAYLTALGKSQVLAAHDLRLRAVEAELTRARLRFDAGKAPRVEVLRAEAALASAEAERVALAAAVGNAERDLARLLGVAPESGETRAARLAPVRLADPAPPPREALAERAVAASPAVEQARRQVAVAEANEALAKSALRPELRAVGNLNEWGSGEGDFTAEWNAGFQVAVPLFDGGATRRRIARAEASRRAAAEQLREAELEVRAEVDRAAAATEEAQARASSLGKAVERFVEVARVQKLLLDTGAGTQTDYLNAEAELLAARASLAEAGNAAVLARTDLARAAGQLGPDWLRQSLISAPPSPVEGTR